MMFIELSLEINSGSAFKVITMCDDDFELVKAYTHYALTTISKKIVLLILSKTIYYTQNCYKGKKIKNGFPEWEFFHLFDVFQ